MPHPFLAQDSRSRLTAVPAGKNRLRAPHSHTATLRTHHAQLALAVALISTVGGSVREQRRLPSRSNRSPKSRLASSMYHELA